MKYFSMLYTALFTLTPVTFCQKKFNAKTQRSKNAKIFFPFASLRLCVFALKNVLTIVTEKVNKALCIFVISTAASLSAAVQQDLPKEEPPPLKDPKEIINLQLKSLDHLTEMTKLTLNKMAQIRANVVKYQMLQQLYLQQTKDKELLHRMSKVANDLLQEIKNAHLMHAFDVEFISELNMFSKIYKKNEIPKL